MSQISQGSDHITMASRLLKEEHGIKFWQDNVSGIVYANDVKKNRTIACHPSHIVKRKNSVMNLHDWGWNQGDRLIRAMGSIFNVEIFDASTPIEAEIGRLCGCVGCIFRRDAQAKLVSVRRLITACAALHKSDLETRHHGAYNTTGWDKRCPICARIIKAAGRHGLNLPDPQKILEIEKDI